MLQHAIEFSVNGNRYKVDVPSKRLLIHLLRDDLELTGTKEGCSIGVCGACSVLVDGRLVSACLTLAVSCQGKEITTIEGLATEEGLHPLQKAFLNVGGMQCGVCTPGQIIAAKALLDSTSEPSENEVKDWMAGNLCRCTGYYKIVQAILAVAAENKGPVATS